VVDSKASKENERVKDQAVKVRTKRLEIVVLLQRRLHQVVLKGMVVNRWKCHSIQEADRLHGCQALGSHELGRFCDKGIERLDVTVSPDRLPLDGGGNESLDGLQAQVLWSSSSAMYELIGSNRRISKMTVRERERERERERCAFAIVLKQGTGWQ